MKIYLCGGFHSGWDDKAAQLLPTWECIQPKNINVGKDKEKFTPMDIGLIEMSRAVLCMVEDLTPGLNWVFELGWAAARGKHIVIVVEPGVFDKIPERYLGMPLASADVVYDNLEAACLYLNAWWYGSLVPVTPPADPIIVQKTKPDCKYPAESIGGWRLDFIDSNDREEIARFALADTAMHMETGGSTCFWGRASTHTEALYLAAGMVQEDDQFVIEAEEYLAFVKRARYFDEKQPAVHEYIAACLQRIAT